MAKGMTTKVRMALAMKQEYHSCVAGIVKVQYDAGTSELQALRFAVSRGNRSTVKIASVMPKTTTPFGNHACIITSESSSSDSQNIYYT